VSFQVPRAPTAGKVERARGKSVEYYWGTFVAEKMLPKFPKCAGFRVLPRRIRLGPQKIRVRGGYHGARGDRDLTKVSVTFGCVRGFEKASILLSALRNVPLGWVETQGTVFGFSGLATIFNHGGGRKPLLVRILGAPLALVLSRLIGRAFPPQLPRTVPRRRGAKGRVRLS